MGMLAAAQKMVNVYDLQAQAVSLGVLNKDLSSPNENGQGVKINHDIFKVAMIESEVKRSIE